MNQQRLQNYVDNSIASDVSGETYDYILKSVQEYGIYPLDLGEFDEDIN